MSRPETELLVLAPLLPHIRRTFIDVGAGSGAFASWLISEGFAGTASPVDAGELPREAGVLRIGSAGNALRELQNLGTVPADVLVVAYSAPGLSAGAEPAAPEKLIAQATKLGFPHCLAARRIREGIEWISAQPHVFEPGEQGHLIFIQDSPYQQARPALHSLMAETAAYLATQLTRVQDEQSRIIQQLTAEKAQSLTQVQEKDAACHDLQGVAREQEQTMLRHYVQFAALEREISRLQELVTASEARLQDLLRPAAPPQGQLYRPKRSFLRRVVEKAARRLDAALASSLPYELGKMEQYAPRPVKPEKFPKLRATGEWPRICLITPSYQQAAYLELTMASVLDQHYPNLAYGVQDGGSSDGSAEIITRHISRLYHAESARDTGQAEAIQRGFSKLYPENEDIMAWLNSDDLLMPGALAYVGAYFASNPEVDVIYGHRVVIDPAGDEIGRWYLPAYHKDTLPWFDLVPQETLFWRARCYEKAGKINPEMQFAMDWDLLLRLEQAGCCIRRVPYFLGCFRHHPAQKTSARIHTIGEAEMQVLRRRTHGTVPPNWKILEHLAAEKRRSTRVAWLAQYRLLR